MRKMILTGILLTICSIVIYSAIGDRLSITNDNGTVQYFNIANDGAITAIGAQTITGDIGITGGVTTSGDVDINGSLLLDVTAIVSHGTHTLTATQSGYIVVAASSAITIALPTASSATGLSYTIKLDSSTVTGIDVYSVTIDPYGTETIDDATTNADIDNWKDYITVLSDGTSEWFIISEKAH